MLKTKNRVRPYLEALEDRLVPSTTWTRAASGQTTFYFDDAANWSNGAPGTGNDAVFDGTGSAIATVRGTPGLFDYYNMGSGDITVTSGHSAAIRIQSGKELWLGNGSVLTWNSSSQLGAETVHEGRLTVADGATATFTDGNISLRYVYVYGTLNLRGGFDGLGSTTGAADNMDIIVGQEGTPSDDDGAVVVGGTGGNELTQNISVYDTGTDDRRVAIRIDTSGSALTFANTDYGQTGVSSKGGFVAAGSFTDEAPWILNRGAVNMNNYDADASLRCVFSIYQDAGLTSPQINIAAKVQFTDPQQDAWGSIFLDRGTLNLADGAEVEGDSFAWQGAAIVYVAGYASLDGNVNANGGTVDLYGEGANLEVYNLTIGGSCTWRFKINGTTESCVEVLNDFSVGSVNVNIYIYGSSPSGTNYVFWWEDEDFDADTDGNWTYDFPRDYTPTLNVDVFDGSALRIVY